MCESEVEIKVSMFTRLRVASFRFFEVENRDPVLASSVKCLESSNVGGPKHTPVTRVLPGLKIV